MHDAVLVGIGTVLADDPRLTVRRVKGKNPVRVVLDSRLRIPYHANILRERASNTIICTTKKAPKRKITGIRKIGAFVIIVRSSGPRGIDLTQILRILYKKGVKKLLVEGGSDIITSFLERRLADRVVVITAPVIFGCGVPAAKMPLRLVLKTVKKLGEDIVCEFVPEKVSR